MERPKDIAEDRSPHALPIFPSFVALHSMAFEVTSDVETQVLGLSLPSSLARVAPKRRREFYAGRACVRFALRSLGFHAPNVDIPIGDHRAPKWPLGIVGSITHVEGLAAAAVAFVRDTQGVGIDAEPMMTDQLASEIGNEVARRNERDLVMDSTGWSEGEALTAIFSVKETLFKTLYPLVGRYFDFHDIEVAEMDVGAARFRACLRADLSLDLRVGTCLEGGVYQERDLLWTGMVLPALAAVRAVDGPECPTQGSRRA